MKKQPIFNRNQLALAVSVALLGSVMTGCSSSSDSAAPPGEATASANGGTGGPGGQGGCWNTKRRVAKDPQRIELFDERGKQVV